MSDVLRVKNNRQPTVKLKALALDPKQLVRPHSILKELGNKADTTKKIIVAITQKSLDQFFAEVRTMFS